MSKAIELPSLVEINSTISSSTERSFWRSLWTFSGPGALVAVGYMDPGNWVTSIQGGASYGYLLLSIVLLSSITAMVLQYMSAKLGIVTGMDLAQAMRVHTGRRTAIILWIIGELAIMATDIAEVIGSAIALNLLFHIPLTIGVLITVFDVFALLLLMHLGVRKIEAIVIALITTILTVFAYEVWLADPNPSEMLMGFVPQPDILKPGQLTLALGIIGATVMPHNLYLHSAIVQSRSIDRDDLDSIRHAVRFSTWDSNIQLSVAFVINMLLLLLGASLFAGKDPASFESLSAVYDSLQQSAIVGPIASATLSTMFALALLASGQNSTITGTLSGQVVMEGFLRIRLPVWARRLITRLLAVIPVVICTIIYNGSGSALDNLLINSQVFLSIALPFSIFPLVWFTSNRKIMGVFVNPRWITWFGWITAIILTCLNVQLIWQILTGTAA